jgi:hypothetical protein
MDRRVVSGLVVRVCSAAGAARPPPGGAGVGADWGPEAAGSVITLEAGATSSVKAVKLSATLVGSRRPDVNATTAPWRAEPGQADMG